MKKVNVLWLIASICWFFWTLINVFELLTDVPFIISVCGTIFIFAAVVVHLEEHGGNTGDGSVGTRGTVLCVDKNLKLGRLVFTNRPFHNF